MKQDFDSKEIQRLSYEILKFFKEICDNNGITYYLAYGSALGAIRHHNFIPWDDDIDVYLTRSGLKKLEKVLGRKKHGNYKLLTVNLDSRYDLPLPKIIDTRTKLIQSNHFKPRMLGVYIDIFVLDNVPCDMNVRKSFFDELKKAENRWVFFNYNPCERSKISRMIHYCFNLVGYILNISHFYAKRIDKIAQRYSSSNYSSVSNLTYEVYGREKEVLESGVFGDGVYCMFGDYSFRVPKNYDLYLKTMYGNYTELPPIEKQISHHSFHSYWKKLGA